MKCGRVTYAPSATYCGTPTISGLILPRNTAPDMGCPCAERMPKVGGASSTCIIPRPRPLIRYLELCYPKTGFGSINGSRGRDPITFRIGTEKCYVHRNARLTNSLVGPP